MSRETIRAKVESLPSKPVVFEVHWDGDSSGWFVRFSATTEDGQSHQLGTLSGGGDIRIFNGQVAEGAWPEALEAQQLGSELAKRYGAEFYFPSPQHPEDECPDWKHREQGYPCRRCGILLLQSQPCPWHGLCHYCHLDEAREEREAKWTPEQRAGQRCHICGDPASNPVANQLNGGPVCASCFGKYQTYACEKCGAAVMIAKTRSHTSLCSGCELQQTFDSLTAAQRNRIRGAMAKGRLQALQLVEDITGCSLYQAQELLQRLGDPTTDENPT